MENERIIELQLLDILSEQEWEDQKLLENRENNGL